MKRISISLTDAERKKLKRIARFHRRSMDQEGAIAIQAHLQKLNPEAK